MSQKYDYNIIVLGAGSGGLVASYITAAVKGKVLLIEKHKMGGDCLNTGCVPSKALISAAKLSQQIKEAEKFGLENASATVNFQKVMAHVHNAVTKIEPHDSVERYQKLGVECITGAGKIIDPHHVEVNGETYSTRSIIISTGASPLVPPIPGLDKINYLTSDNLWELKELPKRMIILGGRPIGCEMTQSFARLGAKVTQVEMMSRLMIREDEEVSSALETKFKAEGVEVRTDHKALEVTEKDGTHYLLCEHQGKTGSIAFDQILLALGRKPNAAGFGAQELGIKQHSTGAILANDFMQTNIPNIYVCGDITGPYQFTHTASHQAWYAAVNALFSPLKRFKVDYSVIPWATFTDPEIARVGINEQEAKEQGLDIEITHYDLSDSDRAIAEGKDAGFIKVITPKGKDIILGATIMGPHAGELITAFIYGMKWKLGLNKILSTIHIYPTFSESNKMLAGNWRKAHTPAKILKFLEIFHRWRR